MSFVVEDGTRVAGANSYVSVAYANTYFDDRNVTAWADITIPEKEFALIKATDYIEKRFRMQFIGYRQAKDQPLSWPRYDAVLEDGWWIDGDTIPVEVKQAVCEYAYQAALTGSLISATATESSASPKVAESIKVGPISVTERYKDSASNARSLPISVVSSSSIPEYPAADLILQPLLNDGLATDLVRG